jgi:hypothetical protein
LKAPILKNVYMKTELVSNILFYTTVSSIINFLKPKKLASPSDRAGVPDLSASIDNSDLAEDDPCDPTTTSKPEAPMQSLNQLPVITDLADARSA